MDVDDALRALPKLLRQRKLFQYSPYPFQEAFHAAGKDNKERALIAANGVGKTVPGAAETAMHLTGLYPDWWEGHRFDRPILAWIGSISNQTQRDYTQPALLGTDLTESYGTGFIPKANLIGKPRIRQAGIADVADIVRVRHATGGVSTVIMKSYEQGWRMWQGAAPDIIWGDEQMDERAVNERDIFQEMQTRVFRSGGLLYFTLTPLFGTTDMIDHFMNPKAKGIFWIGATWDDAPHLAESDKQRLIATYPDWAVDTRTRGVPMMGEGRVFTTNEDDIRIEPIPLEPWWARIKGIDFGIGHPAAVADLAWDRDNDVIYVTRTWRKSGAESEEHAEAINEVDPWVPVAWPHDGDTREKSSGIRLKDFYVRHGVRMLGKSARYKTDTGGGQPVEPVVLEIQERARNGGFKVFSNCKELFDEWRNYHRKDGNIVPIRDDVLKATMYALMSKRFAMAKGFSAVRQAPMQPVVRV